MTVDMRPNKWKNYHRISSAAQALSIILAANCAQAFLHSGGDPGLESGVRGLSHTHGGGGQTTAAAGIQRM